MPRLKLRASEAWCRLERQMPKSVCMSAPKESRRLLWTQARAAHAPAASSTAGRRHHNSRRCCSMCANRLGSPTERA